MSGREREDNIVSRCGGSVADEEASSECVREEEMVEVKQELAAVKAEMERRVDQLHSQLHYWQNVTVNILKDHYSSIDTRGKHVSTSNSTAYQIMNLKIHP